MFAYTPSAHPVKAKNRPLKDCVQERCDLGKCDNAPQKVVNQPDQWTVLSKLLGRTHHIVWPHNATGFEIPTIELHSEANFVRLMRLHKWIFQAGVSRNAIVIITWKEIVASFKRSVGGLKTDKHMQRSAKLGGDLEGLILAGRLRST